MKEESFVPNVKLIKTLRDIGYTNYGAICDIIDNSIDAQKSTKKPFINVDVRIPKNNPYNGCITIIDNGSGMDINRLKEALVLGSETDKTRLKDLGIFGIGLKSSAISIGSRLEIITRNKKSGVANIGIYDIDKAIELNKWDFPEVRKCNESEMEFFNDELKNSTGTIVKIKKLDRLSNKNQTQFESILRNHLGENFRYFISENNEDNKIKLTLNNKIVNKIDITCMDLKDTVILNPDDYDKFREFTVDGVVVKFKLNHYFISPEAKKFENNDPRMPNAINQGIYVLRNNRQIKRGELFNIRVKHNTLNFYRAELFFDSIYDDVFRTDAKKTSIKLPQEFIDLLKSEIIDMTSLSRKKYLESNPSYKDEDLLDQLSHIEKRFNDDLNTPTLLNNIDGDKIFKNDIVSSKSSKESKPNKESKKDVEGEKNTHKEKIKFEVKHLGIYSPFFYPTPTGANKFLIELNADHAYFEKYKDLQVEYKDQILRLLYSATLSIYFTMYKRNGIDEHLLNDFLIQWSTNLTKLM